MAHSSLNQDRVDFTLSQAAHMSYSVDSIIEGSFDGTHEDLGWFHPSISRHMAEALLMHNGCEGTYLLRKSGTHQGHLTLSLRAADAVQHFDIQVEDNVYLFGMGRFNSFKEFVDHFDQMPVISGDNGVLTQLKYPYPRHIDEPQMYDSVRLHTVMCHDTTTTENISKKKLHNTDLSIASKSGHLTKQGAVRKNWKTRWFTLRNNELKYFRKRGDEKPLRVIDLNEVQEVSVDESRNKNNCFRLVLPSRIFYMFASTRAEMEDWMEMIRWRKRISQVDEQDAL